MILKSGKKFSIRYLERETGIVSSLFFSLRRDDYVKKKRKWEVSIK